MSKKFFPRASGILMHITSLPSSGGIGDLGSEAYRFVDFLARAGQRYWQILPLGPTGFGDSPYQCFSAFAGNTLLINIEQLVKDELLPAEHFEPFQKSVSPHVNFGAVFVWKSAMLKRSYEHFRERRPIHLVNEFFQFCEDEQYWLEDYAYYRALKAYMGEKPWWEWEAPYKEREAQALSQIGHLLEEEIFFWKYKQWLFFRQWRKLKKYASQAGIQIIGDLPIFVAQDSSDTWANPSLFLLDNDKKPSFVAGVPPDYFSPTGQLWGNPLYQWEALKDLGYAWWIERFRSLFKLVDVARVDHFRGFEAYWAVPHGNATAENGAWIPGPKEDLFYAVQDALGELPIIAEDLGFITPEVTALRDRFQFPGMKILQFSFFEGEQEDCIGKSFPELPYTYDENSVCYTGTHDNETTLGWYQNDANETERKTLASYLGKENFEVWDMIRLAWLAPSHTAIVPMQDILSLGSEARMNFPGHSSDNWQWRCESHHINEELATKLFELTELAGRVNQEKTILNPTVALV